MSTIAGSGADGVSDDGGDRALVRRLFERVYSKGELRLVSDLLAADVTVSGTDSSVAFVGHEGVKTHVRRLRTAFHGFTLEIDDLAASRGTFEVSWTAHGTHERPFLGIAPACTIGRAGVEPHGPRFAVTGVATGTIVAGRITDAVVTWDEAALRRQLGSPVADGDLDSLMETGVDPDGSGARSPPVRTVVDRQNRTIEIYPYASGPRPDEVEALVGMYGSFDPTQRTSGLPPVGAAEIRGWVARLLADHCLIAWHGTRPVGQIVLLADPPRGHELALYVHPAYQSCGLGSELMAAILDAGVHADVDRVHLLTENPTMANLTRKCGFRTTDGTDGQIAFSRHLQASLVGGDAP